MPLETTITTTDRALRCRFAKPASLTFMNDELELELTSRENPERAFGRPIGRPSLLKLTSGTTAAPRAIRFRSQQLLADCDQICETMGITEGDLNFGVIPVSHSYGFSNLLTPLLARGVPMALSRDRLPRAVLDGLAAPARAFFQECRSSIRHSPIQKYPDLSRLRLCISAGAPFRWRSPVFP